MGTLDPRIKHAMREAGKSFAAANNFGLDEVAGPVGGVAPFQSTPVEVVLQCKSLQTVPLLQSAGLTVDSVSQGTMPIISGRIAWDSVASLAEVPGVEKVELSRQMVDELDLSSSELHLPELRLALPGCTGAGTIIGIIDSGIDLQHSAFRKADGSSRVLFLWDQSETLAHGSVPYGREYTQAEINAKLQGLDSPVRQVDSSGHGSHVAGIAAGNESGQGGIYGGVAPEADIVIVKAAQEIVGNQLLPIGRSKRIVDAFHFIVDRAAGTPVAINQSQGMNAGGHMGESPLERVIDSLARRPGVAIIKSAGNETGQRIHSEGLVSLGRPLELELLIEANNVVEDFIEIWMSGTDRLSIAVEAPGARLDFVDPFNVIEQTTPSGNRVTIDFEENSYGTGDTLATITLARGAMSFVQPGIWKILIRGNHVEDGRIDAWIERANRQQGSGEQARFTANSSSESRTVTVPGNARHAITVGSYVTRFGPDSLAVGNPSAFSSRGPSRLGVHKPDLAAPGEWIVSIRSAAAISPVFGPNPDQAHATVCGTSMAAPHVAGVATLILQQKPDLTGDQVQQLLRATTTRSGFANAAPDGTWGNGRLDALAALQLAIQATFVKILAVALAGSQVRITLDLPATCALRLHRHDLRLLLGETERSRASLQPDTFHVFDLSDLDPGEWFFEVAAFSAENLRTLDDNGSATYRLIIP